MPEMIYTSNQFVSIEAVASRQTSILKYWPQNSLNSLQIYVFQSYISFFKAMTSKQPQLSLLVYLSFDTFRLL